MAYELAVRLKNPNSIKIVEKVLRSFQKDPLIIRGSSILEKLDFVCPQAANPSTLYNLMHAEILIKHTPSKDIRDYFFTINFQQMAPFFKKEVLASEAIREYEENAKTVAPLEVSFAATLPKKFSSGIVDFEEIYPTLKRIAASAKREMWIVNPFFDEYGAKTMLPSLLGVAGHGATVKILGRDIHKPSGRDAPSPVEIFAEAFADNDLSPHLEIRDFFRKDSKGNQIYALHTKMMIADEIFAYIGSANLTKHSLRNNFEIGVVLKGGKVSSLADIAKKIWANATVVNFDKIKKD
jgi:HKD family nuclease